MTGSTTDVPEQWANVPRNLFRDEGKGKRLFTLMPGLNRDRRKEIVKKFTPYAAEVTKASSKKQAQEAVLTAAILNLRRRPTRFWSMWLPCIRNSPPKNARQPLVPSIDYHLLDAYAPGFLECAPDREQLEALIPDLSELEEQTHHALDKIDGHAPSKPTLEPLMIWCRVRADLNRWDQLTEDERERLVNAIYALDGITAGARFFRDAAAAVPDCKAYFAKSATEDGGANAMVEEPMCSVADDSKNELQTEWTNLWSGVADVTERASLASPGRQLLTELREWMESIDRVEALIPQTMDCTAELSALRERLVEMLGQAAEQYEFVWLAENERNRIVELWREMEASDAAIENCRQACEAVEYLCREASDLSGDLKRCRQSLFTLELPLGQPSAPSERKARIEAKRSIQDSISRIEERLAGIEESIAKAATPRISAEVVVQEVRSNMPLHAPDRDSARASPHNSDDLSIVPIPASNSSDTADAVVADDASQSVHQTTQFDGTSLSLTEASCEEVSCGRVCTLASVEQNPGAQEADSSLSPQLKSSGVMETDGSSQDTSRFSDSTGARCSPIWKALREGHPREAYFYARALHQIEPDLTVPSPYLIKACVFAAEVRMGHGQLSRELQTAYAHIDRESFEEGPEEWRVAMSLLLVAATLRPAVIAPGTGATGVMHYAHPTEPIHNLRQLVVEHSERLQGLTLDPVAFRTLFNVTGWDDEMLRLTEEIAEWIRHAPSRTIKFQAATEVWKRLLSPGGKIGSLVRLLIDKPTPRVPDIAAELDALSEPNSFESLVHRVDRIEAKRRIGDDIHARAFDQLRDLAEGAFELVRRWISLMQSRPERKDYLVKQLEEFQRDLGQMRTPVERELDRLVKQSADPHRLIEAAVQMVRASLIGLDRIFDPTTIDVDGEPLPDILLGLPLLAAPSIDLNREWLPEQNPVEQISALDRLLEAKVINWEAAFSDRCERGDLDGAARICDHFEKLDPILAGRLNKRFREQRELHRARLRNSLEKARSALERSLAFGYIQNEQERATFDARLVGLEADFESVSKFQCAEHDIEALVQELQARQDQRIREIQAELGQLTLDFSSAEYRRLMDVVNQGDVVTANEYLQRIRENKPLPVDTEGDRDIFAAFFPAGAKAVEDYFGGGNVSTKDVEEAVRKGVPLGELHLADVGKTQLASASDMVRSWYALKRSERPDTQNLGAFFSAIGFSSVKVRMGGAVTQGRAEVELDVEPVQNRLVCPVPSFGSQAAGRYRVVCMWKRPTDDDLLRQIGDVRGGRATIVLYFGRLLEKQRRDIARKCRETGKAFLLADEILTVYLCSEAKSRLAAFFACTLPFTLVEPFVTTSGQVPPEMFYGRQSELRRVTDSHGACFVYGGRQLGKTALLREAQRSFHNPATGRYALFIDLRVEGIGYAREPAEIWGLLYRELKAMLPHQAVLSLAEPVANRKGSVDAFISSLASYFSISNEHRLLLLLDEADRFLEQDSRGYGRPEYSADFIETARLRGLMDDTQRMIKVVFAGLHNVVRTTEQANHPLAHFGDPIEIGPLMGTNEWHEARRLIRLPLLAAGYQVGSESLVDRILAQTNYYPSLIQLYCSQLVRQLQTGRHLDRGGPRYLISNQLVDEAYQSKDLREAINSRFHLTLQLDLRYELIAYAVAYGILTKSILFSDGADLRQIRREALTWWPDGFAGTTDQEFKTIIDEMIGLGVLRHVGESNYSLRNPNILRLLGPIEEIEAKLLRQRELPQEFEPDVFHALNPKDALSPVRCPFTFSQERSLQRRTNGVTVVVGASAAGLGDLEFFLQRRIAPAFLAGGNSILDRGTFNKALDNLELRHGGGTTVVVVPESAPWNAEWANQALERLARLRAEDKHVRVVFVADPPALDQLLEDLESLGPSLEIVSLRPWRERFVRQWLDDCGVVDQTPDTRTDLKRLTGLWPAILTSGAQRAKGTHQVAQLIKGVEDYLSEKSTRTQLLDEFGLTRNGGERFARLLSDLGGEATEGDMNDFSSDYGVSVDGIRHWVRWAALLHIVGETGRGYWKLDPFIKSLLDA